MDKRTANNVHKAFTEEAKAHIRLNVFTEKANERDPLKSHIFSGLWLNQRVFMLRTRATVFICVC